MSRLLKFRTQVMLIMMGLGCITSDLSAQRTIAQQYHSPMITLDASTVGRLVKNIFSDVNVWDFRENWSIKASSQEANYFATHYPDDLILALQNVIRQGFKPMIKTEAVPLKYSHDPSIGTFGVNIRPVQ